MHSPSPTLITGGFFLLHTNMHGRFIQLQHGTHPDPTTHPDVSHLAHAAAEAPSPPCPFTLVFFSLSSHLALALFSYPSSGLIPHLVWTLMIDSWMVT